VAGVTTVFDALCLGDLGFDESRMRTFHDGVADLDAMTGTGLLKSEHFLHLRCEMPAADVIDMLEPVAEHPRARMLSLMDHSPGVGQYADIENYRAIKRKAGIPADFVERRIEELLAQRARLRTPHRRKMLDMVAHRVACGEMTIASHDDETVAEIAENHADGIRISEFPVRMAAAAAAHAHGMTVIAGAPNIVRGGSHSGNVNAADLVRAGNVDAFASDYVPAALVEAAFICADTTGISLPAAVAMITANAAAMVGLDDRGRLEAGKRADLVRVRLHGKLPVVRAVWRAGERVA
jgi:alpha-D-ribose 1-methylphosphonate 5-triphosphate diphosphatase